MPSTLLEPWFPKARFTLRGTVWSEPMTSLTRGFRSKRIAAGSRIRFPSPSSYGLFKWENSPRMERPFIRLMALTEES